MGQIPAEIAYAVPAIGVVLEVARRSFRLPDRYTPAVAVGLGVVVAVAVIASTSVGVLPAIVGGVLAGAAPVGLHQTGKQITKSE